MLLLYGSEVGFDVLVYGEGSMGEGGNERYDGGGANLWVRVRCMEGVVVVRREGGVRVGVRVRVSG